MSDEHSDRGEQIWQRLHQIILDAVSAILGPPPPDVMQKIEGVLREAKRVWEESKECQDETDQTP